MPQYVAPIRDASSTGLSSTRLRRLITAFRRIPRYQYAAAAAGISAATLVAWRRRGQQDLDTLDEQTLDAVLALRDPETAPRGRPASWREIEAQVGAPVSVFARLVLELGEAESGTACKMFGLVMEAAHGRYELVEHEDGTVSQKVLQPPQWTASAWVLERVFGFVRPAPGASAECGGELLPIEEGYARLRASLDAVSGNNPQEQ